MGKRQLVPVTVNACFKVGDITSNADLSVHQEFPLFQRMVNMKVAYCIISDPFVPLSQPMQNSPLPNIKTSTK